MKSLALITLLLLNISFGYSQSKDSVSRHEKIAPWFVERFKISAGFFYVVNQTNIQVSVEGEQGTNINLEKDFDFNKTVGTFLVNAQWRISRRSVLAASYYNIDRSATHTLEKDIIFGDNTYHVNSLINSYFNTSIYQFSYGYAIISKPTYEIGLLLGSHVVSANAGISAVGTGSGISINDKFGFTAPLPDLGIWGGVALTNRFALNFDASYFTITTKNFTGRILATNLAFTYKIIPSLTASLAYTGLNFRLDAEKNNLTGLFKWGYNGPTLAATYSFGKRSWKHLENGILK